MAPIRRPRLTAEQRCKIVVLSELGFTSKNIASRIPCNSSCVRKTLTRYRSTGTTAERKHSGRPRKTTEKEDQLIQCLCRSDRLQSERELASQLAGDYGIEVSKSTVGRRLRAVGLFARPMIKKPLLSNRHQLARLAWAKEHKSWTIEDWRKVVWSDESKFNLRGSDGRITVRRTAKEAILPQCLQLMEIGNGGSLMIWGCLSFQGPGPLVKINSNFSGRAYISLLQDHAKPFLSTLDDDYIFMDDNSPLHRAKMVKNWWQSSGINKMEVWPAKSPDLNPIENIWASLKRKVSKKRPRSLKELKSLIMEVWQTISGSEIEHLYNSMPKRIDAVIKANGGATKY